MEHKVDLTEISDGTLYSLNDTVTLSCDGCRCLSEHARCCHFAEDTITLDPFDTFQLTCAGYPFVTLFQKEIISLAPVSSVLLPHLNFNDSGSCPFLDADGRCSIHAFRPGLCRLFPLARGYGENRLFYVKQIHECPIPTGQPVSVRDWLGLADATRYEQFCFDWHTLVTQFRERLQTTSGHETRTTLSTRFLSIFFFAPYETGASFYEQYALRQKEFKEI